MTDEPNVNDLNQSDDAGNAFDPFDENNIVDVPSEVVDAGASGGEQARVSRLSSSGGDEVVREYEQRYRPASAVNDEPKRKRGAAPPLHFPGDAVKSKRPYVPLSYSTMNVTQDERMWAAVAHASIWVTLIGGAISGGMVSVVSLFIPLVIYFAFRQKSDFVAFHALQAFMLQLVATVGVIALVVIGGILWGLGLVLAALSLLVLIGVILLPVWLIVGVAFFVACTALPFVAGVLGAIGAIEVYNGRDYQYPYIARMIDRQLSHSYVRTA
ncbi:MAG: hypothetical protein UZ15_CFX003002604 [Chloroflexi bacterium OLB15]|nr:MAG: hypothetical protein UZ15_CFX003002604 [Chloroflexi bacterium OLB15]